MGKQFYGDVVIENQKPLIVKKYGNIWVVQGSISSESGQKGGVFEIKISSIDGAILGMVHGK